MLSPSTINEACTSVGVAKNGRPIGLDEKIKVDLIVIGSVAVDPKTGARLGKGEVIIQSFLYYKLNVIFASQMHWKYLRVNGWIWSLTIISNLHSENGDGFCYCVKCNTIFAVEDSVRLMSEISECRDLQNLNMGCCGIWELLMTQHQLWPPVVGTLTLDLISYAPFIHTVAMLIITELLFSFNCFDDFLLFKTLAVHDCQLVEDIPVEKLLIHDVPVDIICTPDQVIFTNTNIPKPQGLWITAARSFKSEVYCSFFRVCFIKQPCNGFR